MKPFSVRGWVLSLLLVGWCATDCKCGKGQPSGPEYQSTVSKLPGAANVELAKLVPADAAAALFSEDPGAILRWLEGRPWWQELKKSPPYEDLFLTGQMFELSSLRHRIESFSAVRLKQPKIEELLATPTGLAVRLSSDGFQILLLKQIDLKVQALDRLVEVLNQITPKQGQLATKDVGGLQLRDLALAGGSHLYYVIFSNMLLASNSESMLQDAFHLARGESGASLAQDAEMKQLLADSNKVDLTVLLNLEKFAATKGWFSRLAVLKKVVLTFSASDHPRLDFRAVQGKGSGAGAAFGAGSVLPIDSRLVVGLSNLDAPAVWKEIDADLGSADKLPDEVKVGVEKLVASLAGPAYLVLGGVDLSGGRPFPQVAVLARTTGKENLTQEISRLVGFAVGPVKSVDVAGTKVLGREQDFDSGPALALIDGWLVASSSGSWLQRIAAAASGKAPAIKDIPGFSDHVGGSKPILGLIFADCGLLFEDLKGFAKSAVRSGSRFDRGEVDDTLVPLFEALKKIGKIGGAVAEQGGGLFGSVAAL